MPFFFLYVLIKNLVYLLTVYLSVTPFYFQNFGYSLLSLLWILFQVEWLFPLDLFFLFFNHVSSSVACFSVFSFHLIYCVWGLFSAGCKVIAPLICGICPPWVCWTSALWRFSDWGDFHLHSFGWNWILSLWKAMSCPVVCFCVSMDLVWLWVACLLMGSTSFLICWRFGMRHPALVFAGHWMGSGPSVEMETFGRALAN